MKIRFFRIFKNLNQLKILYTKFKKAESEETFDILKNPLDCNSNKVIYIFLNAKNVSLNSLMQVVWLKSFYLDLPTIKVYTHRKFRKKLKKGLIQEI